jgi:hypothetical protein
VLDRQVRDAASRIEPVGRGEGVGRARILARAARAAAIVVRRVGGERDRAVDRAEEQPRAVLAADEVGVLALPADPGRLAKRLFHHRRGVDEHLELGPGRLLDEPARERLQGLLDRVVVVLALCVDRDPRALGIAFERQRVDLGRIAHPERDHALRLGPHRVRPLAHVGARLHPFHLAVVPVGEPFVQPPRAQRIVGGGRESDRREAQRARLHDQPRLQLVEFRGLGHECGCSC